MDSNQNQLVKLKDLINQSNYKGYLENLSLNHYLPKKFFSVNTEQERLALWQNIEIKLKDIKSFNKVANPYYIGFGNPNADLLIIGQEKAFNAFEEPDLMLYESINNQFQWGKIINEAATNEITFDPRNPRRNHLEGRKGNHTWTKYSILADEYFNLNSCKQNMMKDFKDNQGPTLFDVAFLTEFNVTPATTHSSLTLTEERKQVLTHSFFKQFKIVVFAIGNPQDKGIQEGVKKIFQVSTFEIKSVGQYGSNKDRLVAIGHNGSQTILICNQLSGSSGWKNEHIIKIGELLKH